METNKTLLLIEDNPDDIDLALKAFQPFTNISRIQTARDGAEALNLINSWEDDHNLPSLILLDLNLPFVSGFELLQALKSNQRLSRIPVIILTSSTEESDVRQAYQLGTNSYIKKPIDFSEFQKVASILNNYWNCLNVTTS
jgi:CheY-like chemotaxis protein